MANKTYDLIKAWDEKYTEKLITKPAEKVRNIAHKTSEEIGDLARGFAMEQIATTLSGFGKKPMGYINHNSLNGATGFGGLVGFIGGIFTDYALVSVATHDDYLPAQIAVGVKLLTTGASLVYSLGKQASRKELEKTMEASE